jgi:ABC-type lipoprotein export system ATPase subunit
MWLFADESRSAATCHSRLSRKASQSLQKIVGRLAEALHLAGLTLVIVTHDERIAATADRLISMRDGAFVDETRLVGGTRGNLADLAGLGG